MAPEVQKNFRGHTDLNHGPIGLQPSARMYMVHDFKLLDTNVHSVVNASQSWLKNNRSYGFSKHPDYEVSTPGKR
jgi:hypothetical protein